MLRFPEFLTRPVMLGRISRVPLFIDLRWLLVFAFMSWMTAINLTPRYVETMTSALILGALTTIVLFACVLIHEVAHTIIARREGVEPVEIMLHPFGGLARFRREPDTPRAELRIAIAGPIASLLLTVVFGLLAAGASALGSEAIFILMFLLALWNFMLGVFNLFPGYPLDGGRVLRAYLWRRGTDLNEATIMTGRFGKIIAVVLIVFGITVAIFRGDFFTGFWTVLVGYFLYDSARSIIADVMEFEAMSVEEAMQLPVKVAPDMSLMQFVNTVLNQHRRTVFLVARNKQFYGVLLLEDIKAHPRERWHEILVGEAMRPVEPEYFVDLTTALTEARALMRQNGINAVGVIDRDGALVGFLQRGRLRKRN